MYNGLSQVYCIKPERKNPLDYKGLIGALEEISVTCRMNPFQVFIGVLKTFVVVFCRRRSLSSSSSSSDDDLILRAKRREEEEKKLEAERQRLQ